MVSRESKVLLRNVIRHTDTHNKMWEEDAMWQQKEISNHMREVTQKRVIGHAHMDSDEETMQRKYNGREGNREGERSTFWMRKLQEAEEQDPNRWGHAGFKELYPDDFKEKSNRDASSDSDRKHRRKHKEHKKKKLKKEKHRHKKKSKSSDRDRKQHKRSSEKKSSRHHSDSSPEAANSNLDFSSSESEIESYDYKRRRKPDPSPPRRKRQHHDRSHERSHRGDEHDRDLSCSSGDEKHHQKRRKKRHKRSS